MKLILLNICELISFQKIRTYQLTHNQYCLINIWGFGRHSIFLCLFIISMNYQYEYKRITAQKEVSKNTLGLSRRLLSCTAFQQPLVPLRDNTVHNCSPPLSYTLQKWKVTLSHPKVEQDNMENSPEQMSMFYSQVVRGKTKGIEGMLMDWKTQEMNQPNATQGSYLDPDSNKPTIKSIYGSCLVVQWVGICLPVSRHGFNPWSQKSLCVTTTEPTLKLVCLEPMLRNKRSHCHEKPVRNKK